MGVTPFRDKRVPRNLDAHAPLCTSVTGDLKPMAYFTPRDSTTNRPRRWSRPIGLSAFICYASLGDVRESTTGSLGHRSQKQRLEFQGTGTACTVVNVRSEPFTFRTCQH